MTVHKVSLIVCLLMGMPVDSFPPTGRDEIISDVEIIDDPEALLEDLLYMSTLAEAIENGTIDIDDIQYEDLFE